MREDLSFEIAEQILRADFEAGELFWLQRDRSFFTNDLSHRTWNIRFAGKRADKISLSGYMKIKIFGKSMFAHRVLWLLSHGAWPEKQIDHINGVRSDNRSTNIRAATNRENSRNRSLRTDNSSGLSGVRIHKRLRKWEADISIGGRQEILGYFEDLFSAVCARKSAEIRHSYHANHGRRA